MKPSMCRHARLVRFRIYLDWIREKGVLRSAREIQLETRYYANSLISVIYRNAVRAQNRETSGTDVLRKETVIVWLLIGRDARYTHSMNASDALRFLGDRFPLTRFSFPCEWPSHLRLLLSYIVFVVLLNPHHVFFFLHEYSPTHTVITDL